MLAKLLVQDHMLVEQARKGEWDMMHDDITVLVFSWAKYTHPYPIITAPIATISLCQQPSSHQWA